MYYNYIYLDPRKPGKFIYDNICLLFEPFYIGKGIMNRCYYHLKTKRVDNKIFKNKINKILSLGFNLEDYIIKLNYTEDENKSYENEILLIELIGSDYISTIRKGPLTNICLDNKPPSLKGKTYEEIYGEKSELQRKKRHLHQLSVGGYFKGHKHSEETKKKISESLIAEKNPMWGKKHNEETLKKLSEIKKGKFSGNKNPRSKQFLIHNISTNIYYLVVGNFNKFCENNNISSASLQKTLKTGKPITRGKTMGWIAYDNIHNLNDYQNIQIY